MNNFFVIHSTGIFFNENTNFLQWKWRSREHSWWWCVWFFLRLLREGFDCFTVLFVQRLAASHRGITHKSKTEVSCESANKTGPLLVVRLRSLTNYRIRLDLFVFWLSRIALIVWTEWSVVSILFNTLYSFFLVGVSLLTSDVSLVSDVKKDLSPSGALRR